MKESSYSTSNFVKKEWHDKEKMESISTHIQIGKRAPGDALITG
jgi:hypothetical protein